MKRAAMASPFTTFSLPSELAATEPPEARGLARDEVRLLVARPDELHHGRFRDIGDFLQPGDLVVVNTSATLAAAVDGVRSNGRRVVVHFSTEWEPGTWVIELRSAGSSGPVLDAVVGESIDLPSGVELDLVAAHQAAGKDPGTRLWRAQIFVDGPVERYLAVTGRPITYGHLRDRWPLSAYQTIFGFEPGSAEMPSAGRPFTKDLVAKLIGRGIAFAPVLLHAGVSSLEAWESPQAERFSVPEATARMVNDAVGAGGRIVAVGTTVTRALESVARPDGAVAAGGGWTDLVLGPGRGARVVGGLITGWHEPEASHLLVLEAVAGAGLVQSAYDGALEAGYLWHEFGDSCLLLPHKH